MAPAACEHTPDLNERVAVVESKLDDIAPKVAEMHAIMLQTRGASRLGRGIVGVLGAFGLGTFVSHKWPAFLQWLGS